LAWGQSKDCFAIASTGEVYIDDRCVVPNADLDSGVAGEPDGASFCAQSCSVATFLPCAPPFAGACGDKLLVLGRGVKFGSINSSYHASIIAYVPDSVAQSAAVNDPHFQVALQKAGHKLLLVHQSGCAGLRLRNQVSTTSSWSISRRGNGGQAKVAARCP